MDLGLGAEPWTTLELADAVAPIEVVGLDHAPEVVARAMAHARPGLSFQVGSFDVPVRARLIRVMNVLRDLDPEAVPAVHARVGASVVEGGLVVEGSCGPAGEAGVAHVLRRREGRVVHEALLFWLDGKRGTAPWVFRDRLPRDLLGVPDHPVAAMLDRWMARYRELEPGPRRLERAAEAEPRLQPLSQGFVYRWAVRTTATSGPDPR